MTIIENIPNKRISILWDTDVDYSNKYQEKYKEDSEYFNQEVRKKRMEFVKKYVSDISKITDWGCSATPLHSLCNNYDPFVEKYNILNKDRVKESIGICFFDVIEHVHNIDEFVNNLIINYNPKYFIITIPIISFEFKSYIDIKDWIHFKPNEHYHYFSKNGFIEFFSKYNYKCIESSNIETPPRRDIGSFVFERGDI